MIVAFAAIIHLSNNLGYILPAIIGLESMGIPSPGETALVLAAVLASQGKLDITLVLVIGIASAIVGDNIGYLAGRKLGRDVLEAPGPLRKRRVMVIRAGDRFFQRHGGKAVFLGALGRTRARGRRVAGRDQRHAVQEVLRLERPGRDHLGADVRAGRLLRRAGCGQRARRGGPDRSGFLRRAC